MKQWRLWWINTLFFSFLSSSFSGACNLFGSCSFQTELTSQSPSSLCRPPSAFIIKTKNAHKRMVIPYSSALSHSFSFAHYSVSGSFPINKHDIPTEHRFFFMEKENFYGSHTFLLCALMQLHYGLLKEALKIWHSTLSARGKKNHPRFVLCFFLSPRNGLSWNIKPSERRKAITLLRILKSWWGWLRFASLFDCDLSGKWNTWNRELLKSSTRELTWLT